MVWLLLRIVLAIHLVLRIHHRIIHHFLLHQYFVHGLQFQASLFVLLQFGPQILNNNTFLIIIILTFPSLPLVSFLTGSTEPTRILLKPITSHHPITFLLILHHVFSIIVLISILVHVHLIVTVLLVWELRILSLLYDHGIIELYFDFAWFVCLRHYLIFCCEWPFCCYFVIGFE